MMQWTALTSGITMCQSADVAWIANDSYWLKAAVRRVRPGFLLIGRKRTYGA